MFTYAQLSNTTKPSMAAAAVVKFQHLASSNSHHLDHNLKNHKQYYASTENGQ